MSGATLTANTLSNLRFSSSIRNRCCSDIFEIKSFSYVNDKGDFFENVELVEEKVSLNYNCYLGCGIFTLQKK